MVGGQAAPEGAVVAGKRRIPRPQGCRGAAAEAIFAAHFRSSIMLKPSCAVAALLAVGVALAQPAVTQDDEQRLGAVHFATSCSAQAQKLFDRGMLYQH